MKNKNRFWITVFLLPSLLMFLAIFAYPLISVVYTSFTDTRFMQAGNFIGLNNYIELFTDFPDFWPTLAHTIIWIVLNCTVGVGFGVFVALVLSKRPFGWKVTRTAFMLPSIISGSALAMLLVGIFSPTVGVVNNLIRMLGVKDFSHNWFFDSSTSFFTVTISTLFFQAIATILVMSEIASIPESVFESAYLDGASTVQADWHITIPLLRNIIGTLIILSISGVVNGFDLVYLTTKGGPGIATMNLSVLLHRTINLENNTGLGNTIGVFQLVLGVGLVLIFKRAMKLGKSDY